MANRIDKLQEAITWQNTIINSLGKCDLEERRAILERAWEGLNNMMTKLELYLKRQREKEPTPLAVDTIEQHEAFQLELKKVIRNLQKIRADHQKLAVIKGQAQTDRTKREARELKAELGFRRHAVHIVPRPKNGTKSPPPV